jgi:hypothetical protein
LRLDELAAAQLHGRDEVLLLRLLSRSRMVTRGSQLSRQNSLDNISYTPSFIFPLGDSSTALGSTNFRVLATSIQNYPPRLYQF